MPLRILTSVLLPAPLSPTSPRTCPPLTSSEIPRSACTPPNHFVNPTQRTTGRPAGGAAPSGAAPPSPFVPCTERLADLEDRVHRLAGLQRNRAVRDDGLVLVHPGGTRRERIVRHLLVQLDRLCIDERLPAYPPGRHDLLAVREVERVAAHQDRRELEERAPVRLTDRLARRDELEGLVLGVGHPDEERLR